jgi:hypothetical protein
MHAYCSTSFEAKDQLTLTKLQQEPIYYEDGMLQRNKEFLSVPIPTGQDMVRSGHPEADQVQGMVSLAQRKWLMLKEEAAKRRDGNKKKMVMKELETLDNSKVNHLPFFILFKLVYFLFRILVKALAG